MKRRLASTLVFASLWSSQALGGMWELYGDWDRCVKHKKSIQEYAEYHVKWRQQFLGARCGVSSTDIAKTPTMVFYCHDPEAHLALLFFTTKERCDRVQRHMRDIRGPDDIKTWLDTMHGIKSRIREIMP